jgi:hypothetical protein
MSTTAIEFRAPSVARTTAQRAAEGVVAAYIHALASSSVEAVDAEPSDLRSRIYDAAAAPLGGGFARACESVRPRPARAGSVSIRRRPARRRALLQA